jgi:ABC-type transport system involved in multi-copper enzyme maturation permease subunit
MSTALALDRPKAEASTFRAPRLIRAEVLKLRKRRGLVASVTAMTIGAAVVLYGVLVSLHAANPAHHGPAGGVTNLAHGVFIVGALGTVAAIIVGASAGADDLNSGVFRELVVTGRSRWSLFWARIPGGLAFLLPFVVVAYVLTAAASVGFAGSLAAPSTTLLVESGIYLVAEVAFGFVLALGLASLLGSRAQTIGILLAFFLALTPLLISIKFLGTSRDAIPGAAFERLSPHAILDSGRPQVVMSHAAAVVVLVLWAGIALAIGGWRTATRDA